MLNRHNQGLNLIAADPRNRTRPKDTERCGPRRLGVLPIQQLLQLQLTGPIGLEPHYLPGLMCNKLVCSATKGTSTPILRGWKRGAKDGERRRILSEGLS
jgi:hypothetical protein